MGGVDIADQLRSSYHTHLAGLRNWLPLFYWLLDTIKVNAFLLWRMHDPQATHKRFQLVLSRQLIKEGLEEHQRYMLRKRMVQTRISYPIPGLAPPQVTADAVEGGCWVDNPLHCLNYINRERALTRKCIVCKARTGFHCILCQLTLCKGSACTNRYPCSYKQPN